MAYWFIRWRTWLLTYTLCIDGCNGGFISHITSEDYHTVDVGSSVIMNCNTTLDYAVNWILDSADGRVISKKIAHKGEVVHNKRNHFAMLRPSKGVYNLRLLVASMSDAGTYKCVEDNGFGPGNMVHHLTIVDSTVAPTSAIDSPQQLAQRKSDSSNGLEVQRNAGNTTRPVVCLPWLLLLFTWWPRTA